MEKRALISVAIRSEAFARRGVRLMYIYLWNAELIVATLPVRLLGDGTHWFACALACWTRAFLSSV